MKTLLFVTILLIANMSSAAYESKLQLFQALNSAGFERIVEIGSENKTENVRIVDLNQPEQYPSSLNKYGNKRERVTELDFIFNNGSVSEAWSGKQVAEAFVIEDVILCYKMAKGSVYFLMKYSDNYINCYLLPAKITEVVQALKK